MATPAPYYPNYAYVGPPTVYNGTGNTGGDSGMNFQLLPPILAHFKSLLLEMLNSTLNSRRKSESMV
jgi:hypothetical protein